MQEAKVKSAQHSMKEGSVEPLKEDSVPPAVATSNDSCGSETDDESDTESSLDGTTKPLMEALHVTWRVELFPTLK